MRRHRIIPLVLLLLIIPSALSAYKLKQEWKKNFAVGETAEFELENVNGAIEVTVWDRSEISVTAEIQIKAPSKTKANELYEKLKFIVDAQGDRVSIEADLPRIRQVGFSLGDHTSIRIRYDVRVPRQTSLKLKTTNGSIEARGARGAFDLETVNGGIDLLSADGEGRLKTVNGSITCHLDGFFSGGDLELKTTNGGVELRLPEGAGGDFYAKTTNGSVRLDFTLEGEVRVKRRQVSGRLGDGRGSIKLRATNGNISVDRK
ncbi:MAG: DUF4097 family beta strand repeat protein [Candidatus Krumholzibacteria bacterium]|nr:DUF4097 family beta strand repeat protein [Candidatus Krumholzibacteria bacterium]